MLGSAVVSLIAKQNPDWTATQILSLIQNVVDMVLKRESDAFVYIDPTTGDLPYLSTTDGTYQYSVVIAGVTIWKVGAILVDTSQAIPNIGTMDLVINGQSGLAVSGANNNNFDALFGKVKFGAKSYNKAPTKNTDQSGSIAPSVLFLFNPTTQSKLYRILAYQTTGATLSLSSYIPIADSQLFDLVACVCELIDAMDNGRFADIYQRINNYWLPRLTFNTDKDMHTCFSSNYSW
jgi:hypothetical protein